MREISTYENKSITEKKNERKRQNASRPSIRERDRMVCIESTNENKIEYKGGREREIKREGERESGRERDDKKLKIFDLKS